MAKVIMALAELVEKGAQDDVVRELLAHVAERLTVLWHLVPASLWVFAPSLLKI